MNKGLFITFEGPEGSGKSTQVKLLSEYLTKKKINVITTREPGGTEISEKIRNILLDPKYSNMSDMTELLLYSAARAQHVSEKIIPAIKNGKICISDRFSFATLAYQGYGRNINLDVIKKITCFATQNISPDITFLLDIDPEIGLEKAKIKSNTIFNTNNGDRLENESLEFHKKVRNGYLELAKENDNVTVIKFKKNAIMEIHKKIVDVVESKLWH